MTDAISILAPFVCFISSMVIWVVFVDQQTIRSVQGCTFMILVAIYLMLQRINIKCQEPG